MAAATGSPIKLAGLIYGVSRVVAYQLQALDRKLENITGIFDRKLDVITGANGHGVDAIMERLASQQRNVDHHTNNHNTFFTICIFGTPNQLALAAAENNSPGWTRQSRLSCTPSPPPKDTIPFPHQLHHSFTTSSMDQRDGGQCLIWLQDKMSVCLCWTLCCWNGVPPLSFSSPVYYVLWNVLRCFFAPTLYLLKVCSLGVVFLSSSFPHVFQ